METIKFLPLWISLKIENLLNWIFTYNTNFVRKFFAPNFFIWKGSGVIVMPFAFIWSSLAMILTVANAVIFPEGGWTDIFYLPFLFTGVELIWMALVPVKRLKDLKPKHWRSRLMMLKDPLYKDGYRTREERDIQEILDTKWRDLYGRYFDFATISRVSIYSPLIIIFSAIITYVITRFFI